MKLIEVKNLELGFNFSNNFRKVLDDISFSVEKGKMLAIVGESGCGKTLSVMSILNLLPKNSKITKGEILFKGYDLLKKNEKQMQKIRGKNIALIPQDPMTALNPLYTIENQILEIIKNHQPNIKNPKELLIKALKEVNISNPEERLKSYPHELSGGMKQRIIIAMALVCNADLIIADEPTTALDVTVQSQIMKILNNIKKEKKTAIILITHDLGLVAENADDVAVMYAGKIVEYSDKKSLFKNPLHPYTKALFNSLPNINKEKLKTIEGQPPTIEEKIDGCPFNPRCEKAINICFKNKPNLFFVDEKKVACWLFKKDN